MEKEPTPLTQIAPNEAVMNDEAKHLFHYLCAQYDQISEDLDTRPFPEFSETINHPLGSCFVRCPVGSQRFSIVSVHFDPSVRGQGVFTQFLDYVKNHPHHYRGLEVAIIENKHLAHRLLHRGWQYKSLFSKIFFSEKPTLISDFHSSS